MPEENENTPQEPTWKKINLKEESAPEALNFLKKWFYEGVTIAPDRELMADFINDLENGLAGE